MVDRELVFVYGTLRPHCGTAEATRLAAAAEHLGPATWRGRLYDLGPYPAAVRHAGHDQVRGDLYAFDPATPLLAFLDEYEGHDPQAPDPDGFVRERDEVRTADGRRVAAWIYRYRGRVHPRAWIRTGDWGAPPRP